MPKTRPCPNCGTHVPDGSRFCQGCGGTLADTGRKPAGKSSQWMILVAGAVALLIIVGVAISFMGGGGEKTASQASLAGAIPGAGPLPEWLKTADPMIVADYKWAAEHYEELQYIPCYCGCNSVSHEGNDACYFRRDNDGKILNYDAHALG